ncbi:hypothetical protein BA895_05875 [Humibacillus sp. DSM 29435]|uniref:endonuclease domain-containing protein n=1 Tax=Humibacillus sp. DSM 29435 TaxID=1869167 RepID=UPI000872F4BA|nr:hypothetical protein [Humibacillus sp. DSM 29435]OFE15274.1 hypothetical protein BA895_05875 [Humibacillus sp. DSM 29435]
MRQTVDVADRHRLRVSALLEQYDGRAVASGISALSTLGLPCLEPDWSVAHLMLLAPGRKEHTKADLVVGRALWRPEAARFPPTDQRTVHPAVAIALAGLTTPCSFLVPADAALARRLVTAQELQLAVTVIGQRPGLGRARAALTLMDARHESPGETFTAYVLRLLGHQIVPQFVVPGTAPWTPVGRGFRADFGIVGTRVFVEFDGWVKYASQQHLWDEKRREDRIRSLGWEVVRLTWADLHDPARVGTLIDEALGRAR